MDFITLHLPYANVDVSIPVLLFMGFGVGIISAFLGIGGAWLLTPALNSLGFPMAYAVGTDMAHIGLKGVFGTFYYSKNKNIDYPMALFMLLGTVAGIEGGAQAIMLLENRQTIEPVVGWVYIGILLLVLSIAIFERRNPEANWAKKMQRLLPRPYYYFKTSQIYCSIWLPISVGLVTGFVAGFLGIGGGLLRLPLLIYVVGCPVLVAVGTDLFEVMLSGLYGGVSFAMKGRVDYFAAAYLVIGAFLGTKVGVVAACRVKDRKIKNCFIFAVVGCMISLIFKQLHLPMLSKIATFALVFFLAGSILTIFYRSYFPKKERA